MCNSPIVIYLHGFGSSPNSNKGQLLAHYFQQLGLGHNYYAPYLQPNPPVVIAQLAAFIQQQQQEIVLIGSSLGGFYAAYLAHYYNLKAVLINPAVTPWHFIDRYVGPYFCNYSQKIYTIYPEQGKFLQQLAVTESSSAKNFLLLLQTGDEVLDYQEALTQFPDAQHRIQQGGSHRFENFESMIPTILTFMGIKNIVK